MKLDQLQYFVETARRQHIGQAARFLNISPSAISHSLTALEEEFGRKLFEKQGRQIKLTQHGKLLLDRAEFLLAESQRIHEDLANDQTELRGHYRIAAPPYICSEFLTPQWMGLQNQHPGLSSTIMSLKSAEVLARVDSGEVDLGFCLSPHTGPHHEQEILHKGLLLLSFGKKHSHLKERKLTDLNKYPSIAAMAAQGIESCENHPVFKRFSLSPKISNLFDSYEVAIAALKLNTVWTILPDFIARKNHSMLESYVPKGWDADYKVAAVWPKFRIRTQALDLLVDRMRESILQTLK